MNFRSLKIILSSLILGICLCGCGKEQEIDTVSSATIDIEKILDQANPGVTPDGKTIITIYAQYSDADSMVPYDYALKRVADKFPDVELNMIIQSQDDGATLKTLSQTGQLPDIFQANTNIINMFRETNQIMQLDDVAKETGYIDKVFETNKELVYSDDGHIYCFPYAGNEYVLWYYNKELFEQCELEVPQTIDDLKNCISVFKSNGIVPLALFGQEGWITTAMYDVLATRYIPDGIKGLDNKSTSATDEGYLKAAKDLEVLTQAGLFQSNVAGTEYSKAAEMFLNKKAAMFINGQWFIQDATNALGENVDWMFYPSYNTSSYTASQMAFAGGGSTSGYAVNANSKNAKLAAEIAAFLSEKYCEAKVMYRGNPLVALKTSVTPAEAYPTMMTKLSGTIPSMTSTTKFTWGLSDSTFNEKICTGTQKLVSGDISAENFIQSIK